jgi:beta-galactosidase/beta-glucuronidase
MENLTRRKFMQAAALAMTAEPFCVADPASAEVCTGVHPLDGTDWLLDVDASNSGRNQGWAKQPTTNAKPAKVPWVIQDVFPDYHGVAWYWREFHAPANVHREGQYLLRFHAVDYLGEVWVNGIRVGVHEGGEEPFTLNVTRAIKPEQANLVAVRVLNPTHELIDGIRLEEVAVGRRDYPIPRDNAYNTGGITGSVDLLVAPPVTVENLQVLPDWKTGQLAILANIRNASSHVVPARVTLAASPARGGNSLGSISSVHDLRAGDTKLQHTLAIPNHRLWELNDPFLYKVAARVQASGSVSVDEYSVRCGFRDFRFERDYFRLNGRRVYLHGALYTILQYPISQTTPFDEDLLRRDILNMKMTGFNSIRITCGAALPRQLDLLDEMGLLVCEEHFGARALAESPSL